MAFDFKKEYTGKMEDSHQTSGKKSGLYYSGIMMKSIDFQGIVCYTGRMYK